MDSSYHFLPKATRVPWGKRLIAGVGTEMHKMGLEHLMTARRKLSDSLAPSLRKGLLPKVFNLYLIHTSLD